MVSWAFLEITGNWMVSLTPKDLKGSLGHPPWSPCFSSSLFLWVSVSLHHSSVLSTPVSG